MENNNFDEFNAIFNKYFVPPTHLEQNENSNNLTNPSAYQYEDQIGTSSYDPIAINPIKNNRKIELNETTTTNNIKRINLKNNSKIKPEYLNIFQQNPSTTNNFNDLINKLKEQQKPDNIIAINLKDSSKKKNEFLNKKTKKNLKFTSFEDSPYGKKFEFLKEFNEEYYNELKTKDPSKNNIIDIILKENLSYNIEALIAEAQIFYDDLCHKKLVDENGKLLIFNDKEKNKNNINTYYEIKKLRKKYENFIIENELYLISERLNKPAQKIKLKIEKNSKKEANQYYNKPNTNKKKNADEYEYEYDYKDKIDYLKYYDAFEGDLEIMMNDELDYKSEAEKKISKLESDIEIIINNNDNKYKYESEDEKKISEFENEEKISESEDEKEISENGNLINPNNSQTAQYEDFKESKNSFIKEYIKLKNSENNLEKNTKLKENFVYEFDYDGNDELLETFQNKKPFSYYKKLFEDYFNKDITKNLNNFYQRRRKIKNIMKPEDYKKYSNLLKEIQSKIKEIFNTYKKCVKNKEINSKGEIFNNENSKDKIEKNISSMQKLLISIDNLLKDSENTKAKLEEEKNFKLSEETLNIFLKNINNK